MLTNIEVACTCQREQPGSSNIAILWVFLIKQLFHSRLLDIRWLEQTRRYAPRCLSTISNPTHLVPWHAPSRLFINKAQDTQHLHVYLRAR